MRLFLYRILHRSILKFKIHDPRIIFSLKYFFPNFSGKDTSTNSPTSQRRNAVYWNRRLLPANVPTRRSEGPLQGSWMSCSGNGSTLRYCSNRLLPRCGRISAWNRKAQETEYLISTPPYLISNSISGRF